MGRRTRWTVLPIVVVAAALMGVVAYWFVAGSSSGTPIVAQPSAHSSYEGGRGGRPGSPPGQPPGVRHGALGVADGELPDGVTVFDDEYPAVANLDPALLRALRLASTDAAGDGVEFHVNSGWRSPVFQEQLLEDAVSKYGSREEALQWVATPDTSPHVSGAAVDIGGTDAAEWLSEHGAHYGVCQIYRNEPWHYELRPDALGSGCPPMYPDPTHDPRMQQ